MPKQAVLSIWYNAKPSRQGKFWGARKNNFVRLSYFTHCLKYRIVFHRYFKTNLNFLPIGGVIELAK